VSGSLIDEPLVPDPDAEAELAPGDAEAIADEDLRGSRLLLVGRAAEAIELDGSTGGAIELACTFQPADGTRFAWARLLLRLTAPDGVKILDVAPREVVDEPVTISVDRKGGLSLGVKGVGTAETGLASTKQYVTYHCAVQGSGAATALARWDFKENPDTRDGLGTEQALVLTVPVTGPVRATVTVSARLARSSVAGRVADAVRDLVLPTPQRTFPVTFEVPSDPPPATEGRFR
jgi:hypothetical protein